MYSDLEPFVGDKAQPVPYKRRDFYKIMLVIGNSKVHYADKVIEVKKQALSFSNPQIPYKWEHLDNIRKDSFCVFNQHFFHQYGNLNQYAVFQPNGTHIFELTDEQVDKVTPIYKRMFEEINSDYIHKYDVLRTLVFELLAFCNENAAFRTILTNSGINASQRISTLFLELLERQFPIDENHQTINLRSASDFAKPVKYTCKPPEQGNKRNNTEKTTSQIITERYFTGIKNIVETQ